jgi:hypothetical protein
MRPVWGSPKTKSPEAKRVRFNALMLLRTPLRPHFAGHGLHALSWLRGRCVILFCQGNVPYHPSYKRNSCGPAACHCALLLSDVQPLNVRSPSALDSGVCMIPDLAACTTRAAELCIVQVISRSTPRAQAR